MCENTTRPARAKEILVKLKYHTPEEAIRSLRQAELEMAGGATAQEACKRLGINPGTLWRWQKKYGGMEVSEASRVRELEVENDRLKRVVAELEVDRQILREALRKK
jgi:putative transposase